MKSIFILISLILLIPTIPSASGVDKPYAEIVKVEYPSQVLAGEDFTVRVTVNYSFSGWTLADLGIFQQNYTTIFDYVRYYLTGKTSRSFNLTVAAPDTPDLRLRIDTRYWHQDYWIIDNKGSFEFTVKILNSSITGNHASLNIVTIGQNEWYYWNNTSSDTCLIWLTGGHAFKGHITVNPYEMETFGVMKLINDLSRRYNVLALRKGTEIEAIPYTHQIYRTMIYFSGSSELKQLYNWSIQAGFNFTYLVGYSTGGVAAAYEMTSGDPESWNSPDGAIIISSPLEGAPPYNILGSTSKASSLKANIQLIYGEVWSESTWPQGKKFYDNAPEKTESAWYFKKWHLFPNSSHEVWVEEKDGAHYNNAAYRISAQFIEKCRSLSGKIEGWNDGSIEAWDMTADNWSGEQIPRTNGTSFETKPNNRLKIKIWLYNCSDSSQNRSIFSELVADLYSSEGYIDTRYTNNDGYEEFIIDVPGNWMNKTVKLFITLGGEYRQLYTPTINLTIKPS